MNVAEHGNSHVISTCFAVRKIAVNTNQELHWLLPLIHKYQRQAGSSRVLYILITENNVSLID